MNIWVVGSAPIHKTPDGAPDIIYYANGGVWHKNKIGLGASSHKIITVTPVIVPQSELKLKANYTDRELHETGVVQMIIMKNAPYDGVYIRETLDFSGRCKFDDETSRILGKNLRIISYQKTYKLLGSVFGKVFSVKMILLLFAKHPIKFLVGIFKGRSLSRILFNSREFKISTGVLALLVALCESCREDNFFLLGVSDSGTDYSYQEDPEIKYAYRETASVRDNHINADLWILSNLLKETCYRVRVMDESLKARLDLF